MKKIKILLIALILILGGTFFNNSYAATRNLKAQLERPFTNSKYQYLVPGDTTDLQYTVVKIYDADDKVENEFAYNNVLYCLRGGVGFGSEDVNTNDSISYTELAEMHLNAKEVIAKYKELYNVDLDRTETINAAEVNLYNAILWVLDESYLPKDIVKDAEGTQETVYNAAEYKKELLDKAGVPTSQQADITDDDLEVIQQLAIWYFVNYDEQKAGINPTVSQSTMFPAQFLSINGDNNISDTKANNLDRIYQYLVYGAIDNAGTYEVDSTTGARTKTIETNKFAETTLTIEEKNISVPGMDVGPNSYYKIGPFKIESDVNSRTAEETIDASSIVLYDVNGSPIDKYYVGEDGITKSSIYEFVDNNNVVSKQLKKGIEYYAVFYKPFEKGSAILPFITEDEQYDVSKVKLKITSSYSLSTATFLYATENSNENQAVVELVKEKVSESDEISTEYYDLSLRKYITSIKRNGQNVDIADRTPSIDLSKLDTLDTRTNKKITTAIYKHPKNALLIETGDKVIYTIRVYNEGQLDGKALEITDYLPEGLNLVPASESQINTTYGWVAGEGNVIKTDYLKNTIIKAYDSTKTSLEEGETGWQKAAEGDSGLYYADVQVECEVIAQVSNENQNLKNVAEISNDDGEDRDSVPNNVYNDDKHEPGIEVDGYTPGEQDDDDFEDLLLKGKEFDLSLRKYISSVNGVEPDISRVPQIDTSKLNTIDSQTGEIITTANYVHSKEPVTVKQGDIVTYKIRIYNEGDRDGYATRVTDYLPDGLGFLFTDTGDINSDWFLSGDIDSSPLYGEKGIYASEDEILKKDSYKELFGEEIDLSKIQVIQGSKNEDGTRNMLSVTAGGTIGQIEIEATEKIKAYGSEVEEGDLWQQSTNDPEDGLFYQELEITCIVLKENTYPGILKNVAEITVAKDSEGNEIINIGDDRDSEPNNVYADQNHTPKAEVNGYTPGEQDDDDFEPLQLKYFDLALRKFITGVETNGQVNDITSRIPVLSMNEETGNIVYTHPKEEAPVEVANNDIVIYTLRVYNEGTLAGYAEEITDDIPEGLIFLPEHDINKQYEWKMFDKDGNATDNLEDADKIKTDYLSEAKETDIRNNEIEAFDSSKELGTENPDYKDIKVAFRVMEPNTSDRTIVNSAQISEDSDYDEDSDPGAWNDGEDDQDKEYIYVKYFDLSLLKWVTKSIVTVDGKTTTTETGFKPNTGLTETTGIRDNKENEPVAKVEVDKKKLNKTTVKFAYKIRVTNEGEIAGYATEITDFIPKGLEFKAEDNKKYGWVKEGDDKVTTRALETVLLQPGESAELEIVFTWKNDKNNLGVKTNIAEITEDYNEHNSKDIDSTPDNKQDPYEKEQEDDDDFALVVLSLKTGKGASYTILIMTVITMLAGGIYLIKKYVLTY